MYHPEADRRAIDKERNGVAVADDEVKIGTEAHFSADAIRWKSLETGII